MDKNEKLLQRVRAKKWLLPSGFAILCTMSAASIALCFLSGLSRLEPDWIFNIAADVVGIAICAVLFYGCMNGDKETQETTYLFVALLSSNASALFLDECAWLVQGVPSLRVWNLLVNVLFYLVGVNMVYQFWRYARAALDMNDKLMRWGAYAVQILLVPAMLACLANLFVPLYFYVDEAGVYQRAAAYPLSYTYFVLSICILFGGLLRSNVSRRQKTVVLSFVAIPLLNTALTWNTFGISTQYVAALVSIVMIYSLLYSERSKTLAAKDAELNMATGIQANMLPRIFPPFPERKEFDLYASMDPAKEVGGDFYDFFLTDDDHLAMVIADVSDKGVPAALFMVIAKTLIKNRAQMGGTPAEILGDVNAKLCEGNESKMFVTAWLGILEISSGRLTATNAGHEYPLIKHAGGAFELFKDKHGFVLGGMDGMKYKDYELALEPGAKIFLYTDGVPEASDETENMFGVEQLLAVLNKEPDASPQQILQNVRCAVDEFVKDAKQFDDLTMLSMEYRGTKE
ncbi:MAG: hypothetical protein E7425_07595 [Ruminococcaceae bacterium]|nr:hypothetical protein [Oscillospiraceae bacterium]